jgi:hypothetical protein
LVDVTAVCPLLEEKLSRGTGTSHSNSPTLDRLNSDPTIGYVVGNVWIVSNRANRIKCEANWEQIHEVAEWLQQKESELLK